MERQRAALVLLIVFGCGLVGYGVFVGDQGARYLSVEGAVNATELADDTPVVEYESLEPNARDRFRETLERDEIVRISEGTDFEYGAAVHYEGSYYRTYLVVSDAGTGTMAASIGGGALCLVLGIVGWRVLDVSPPK